MLGCSRERRKSLSRLVGKMRRHSRRYAVRTRVVRIGMPSFAGLLLALACSPADRDVPVPPLLVDTIPGISGSFIVIPDSPSCADCKIELVKVRVRVRASSASRPP